MIAAARSAAAVEARCDLAVVEQARVSAVIDGATLALEDGRKVRLASLIVLREDEPHATAAHEQLTRLAAGRTVALALDETARDRHGRLIAHVFVADDWVQNEMVDAGAARVRTHAGSRRCAAPLLAAEVRARTAKRGLWALPHYRVRDVGALEADIGTFQIVEGTPLSVATSKGRVFVNFGADYRSDFTIAIAGRDAKRLAKDGIDPNIWAGKRIRVRGWLSRINGPELELTHAEQIEIVE